MTRSGKRTRVVNVAALFFTFLLMTVAAGGQAGRMRPADEQFAAGFRLQQAGEHEKAVEAYRAALRLDPKHVGALANSGVSYLALGKYEEAAKAFKEAAALMPEDARVRLYLGQAYAAAGQHTSAVEALKEALRLDPRMVEARQLLGEVYGGLGRNDED